MTLIMVSPLVPESRQTFQLNRRVENVTQLSQYCTHTHLSISDALYDCMVFITDAFIIRIKN